MASPKSARGMVWIDALALDFRQAVRALLATPVLTATVVLSLALGIGATSSIFSLVDSLLLRPLPVRDPGRLAVLVEPRDARDEFHGVPARTRYAVWDEIRRRPELFEGVTAWSSARMAFESGGETQLVDGLWAD